jgi:hypothetical protein
MSIPSDHFLRGIVHPLEWLSEDSPCIAGVCIGYIRLPQSQKQCVYLSKVYCYFVWEKKFIAVHRVGLMTRREYRVDRPFPVT